MVMCEDGNEWRVSRLGGGDHLQSPQSLHDYNNGPAGTADRVLGTSPFEKYEIDTINIFANLFSHHYLQSTIANVIYLLSIIHENMHMLWTEVLQILILFPFAYHPFHPCSRHGCRNYNLIINYNQLYYLMFRLRVKLKNHTYFINRSFAIITS